MWILQIVYQHVRHLLDSTYREQLGVRPTTLNHTQNLFFCYIECTYMFELDPTNSFRDMNAFVRIFEFYLIGS